MTISRFLVVCTCASIVCVDDHAYRFIQIVQIAVHMHTCVPVHHTHRAECSTTTCYTQAKKMHVCACGDMFGTHVPMHHVTERIDLVLSCSAREHTGAQNPTAGKNGVWTL